MQARRFAWRTAAAAVLSFCAASALAQTSDVERLYKEAVEARLHKKFDEARSKLEEAAKIAPANADVFVQLGFTLLAQGDMNGAEAAFKRTLEISPAYVDAKFGLAQIAFRRGDLAGAQQLVDQVLTERPNDADADALRVNIAKAEAEKARPHAAARDSGKPARKTPTVARLDPAVKWIGAARKLRTEGRFAEAEALYREALNRDPRNVDVLVALGLVQGYQQKFDDARLSFEKALSFEPNSLDARIGLVRLSVWTGNIEQAAAQLQLLSTAAPDNREIEGLRARVLLLEGHTAQAEAAFAALVASDGSDVDAVLGLGDARRARGRENAALEAYQKAHILDPESADVRQRLEAPTPKFWRLDIDGNYSTLTGSQPDWSEASVALSRAFGPDTTLTARFFAATRFDHHDQQAELGIAHKFSELFSGYAAASVTPDANFLPQYAIGGGGAFVVTKGGERFGPLSATLDLKFERYSDGNVETISPGLQQSLWSEKLVLTAKWINVFDQQQHHAGGYLARVDWAVVDRLRVFAGYSDALEPSDGVMIPTRSVFGGLSFDVNEQVTLRTNFAHEERENAYNRDVYGVGMTWRF
ncbi:tetratricopeptide repeat protein [Phyllobacterium bourgognense]|uniref:YaiO family outer membrane protein n=1 Tax=Phyllobacterium bourgognense TaxID=314236 RepID=A0A368YMS8_9HYPH|nr:tetratricopeptide repeat protein [Phyllobacterium bourgognense]RCW81533.1 YaiO family outer membrane protein [Phyllobacterium bourgognense]